MKNRNVINSPRLRELKRRKRKILKIKIIIVFFVLVLVFIGLIFLSRIKSFNIKEANISGNSIVETKDIEDIVKKNISGYYLWVFPKTNFLIFPKQKIEKDLLLSFKRLKKISFDLENLTLLKVQVSEYEGKFLWCGTLIPTLSSDLRDNKCYFLDNTGYIFDEAPYFSGEVYFKFYGPIVGAGNNPVGSYFSSNNFINILAFKQNLEQIKLKPVSFWVDEGRGEGEFSLSRDSVTSPRIIFKIDSDYQKNAENLQAALDTEPLRSDIKNKYSSLLYIDLRFGNKVYYKFK